MKSTRQSLGRWGEAYARNFLIERGYRLIAQNVRTPYGEIDLVVAAADDLLVFVEVKTRRSSEYGLPEGSITSKKREHLLAAVEAYLQSHPEFVGDCRLDVIAIRRKPGADLPEIVHFENAIS